VLSIFETQQLTARSTFSFASLFQDSQSPSVRQNLLELATHWQKLSLGAGTAGRPFTREAALAILAVRCLLEFNGPNAARSLIPEKLVEAHLRVVYTIPRNLLYFWSGYSSEPVLAEAAGRLMQRHEEVILEHLKVAVSEGFVLDKGDNGELAVRLLLMIAYADALRGEGRPADLSRPMFHQPVRLLDFLESLFSKEVYTRLCEMHDGNFKDDFANAYVNFSHFVRISDGSVFTPAGAAAALARGMAWQCARNQHSVDIFVAIVFGKDTPFLERYISFLFLQVKNRVTLSTNTFMDQLNKRMIANGFTSHKPIYLRLQLDIGVKDFSFYEKHLPTRKSPRSPKPGEYYYARVGGCDQQAYSVLRSHSRQQALDILRESGILKDHVRKDDAAAQLAINDLKPEWNRSSWDWMEDMEFAEEESKKGSS
jgi:hypothetical protein